MMRRDLIARAAVSAVAATVSLTAMSVAYAGCVGEPTLKFNNGKLRIMQFADIQDDHIIDPRSTELMEKALDAYKPDVVVFSGDNITGGAIINNNQVKQAIDNIVLPVEKRGIPWIGTFGNHDEDSHVRAPLLVTWTETDQYNYYRSFSCNVNPPTAPGVTGQSNAVALVYGSHVELKHPKYALWVLDTGRNAKNPDEIAGQRINARDNTWDHLQPDQINWYRTTSQRFERVFGEKIPGLMWFHHPTHEFDFMWNNDFGTAKDPNVYQYGTAETVIDPYSQNDPSPNQNDRHKIVGERNECVCTGPYNAGIYAAVRERGDVKGMFVGHDHINDYHGNYHGVFLGYAASAGFGTYGFDPGTPGPNQGKQHRLRGVRVFDIDEDTREVFDTYMVKAGDDLGMCIDSNGTGCNAPSIAARSTRLASGNGSGTELDGVDLNADISDPAVAAKYEIKGKRIVAEWPTAPTE